MDYDSSDPHVDTNASEHASVPKSGNLARFFVENRQIALLLLVANLLWGCYSYFSMPQRKDPFIPMRRSVVTVNWPGASAQQVEEFITKPIEQAVSRSNTVSRIDSVSRAGVSNVYVVLDEYTNTDMDKAFSDVKIKLDQVHNLPSGASPIYYEKDLGDTASITLSIASPKISPEVSRRLRSRHDLQFSEDEYSYKQLDDYTDLIARTIQSIGSVSKVTRSGLVPQTVNVTYSRERLAALGLKPATLPVVLGTSNVSSAGGAFDAEGRHVRIDVPRDFQSLQDIGHTVIGATAAGAPIHLADVADIQRGYQDPPSDLDYFSCPDSQGNWQRCRSITLAIYMRSGGNIEQTGRDVDAALDQLKSMVPSDLVVSRISDQPQQVRESVGLFIESLWQAVILVVLVSLIGFREWRSALLMACAIPLTLAMTVGMMALLGLELQQVSITSLIIALGLLVDDPVVAGDAIKRQLILGRPASTAAWLGPTKLGTAIAFATLTNIVAYLPFLLLKGDTGRFLFALPVVMTCALVASRIVSMTFVPLLGYYLLRTPKSEDLEREQTGRFRASYRRLVTWCIQYRKLVTAASLLFLVAGGLLFLNIKQSFFPYDSQYLSYVDIWLPEDASLSATNQAAAQAEGVIERVAAKYGAEQGEPGHPRKVLISLSTFVGSSSPRFWFTVFPQEPQPNYATIIVHVAEKGDTRRLQYRLQDALSSEIPGARIDVHELGTGRPIDIPTAVRIIGNDPDKLRQIADSVKQIYNNDPYATRVRDDWGSYGVHLAVKADTDKAAQYGVTEQDIADASNTDISGSPVGVLREGDTQIPIIARLRRQDRGEITDLNDLNVSSSLDGRSVPLQQVATITPVMEPMVFRRRNQFACITVSCFPTEGHLAADVDKAALPQMKKLEATLPPGYRIEQGGEQEEQIRSFLQLVSVLIVSVICIYLALVFEFKNVVKPLLVFATAPYGMVGAVFGLRLMGQPFGFMAFLGIISLVGVLVSHIIVLFDFIETAHKRGDELETALLDAGVQRLRPILITVGATVLAFVPLAIHGGPLWEPLCYAQIGGLLIGAFSTLLLVPMLYTLFVKDWKLIKWEK